MDGDLARLFLALGIFAVGFVSIGPNILAIIGTSMERGRQRGAMLALGVGTGSGIWASLTVAGLTSLLTVYAEAVTLLKIFGAAYLLWLAVKAFRSAATPGSGLPAKLPKDKNLYLRGLIIQMTNPKAALQWVAIVSIGLGPDAPAWVGAALIVSATSLSLVVHLAYAITFSTRPVIIFYQRFRRWIEGTLGAFFSFAAFKVATYRE
ncbi:MAG: LysE family translocator [Pseudomonadota bacterium]